MNKLITKWKIVAITVLTTTMSVLPYTGSDGTKTDLVNSQTCNEKPTSSNTCVNSGFPDYNCTGWCQADSYDRSCGSCGPAYFPSCQKYTGRVAVHSQTAKKDCVKVYPLPFVPACVCPALGTPTPVGTVTCDCAN